MWILLLVILNLVSNGLIVFGMPTADSKPNCKFPPIDFPAQSIDVLGDWEKSKICSLPKPSHFCKEIGPADSTCKTIARAAGWTSNATCSHLNTCSFLVNSPIQHPSKPAYGHVSLCLSDYAGVIFPCRENNLFIVDPDYKRSIANNCSKHDECEDENCPKYTAMNMTVEEKSNCGIRPIYFPIQTTDFKKNATNSSVPNDQYFNTFAPVQENFDCRFPPIDFQAQKMDVLGDWEKSKICSLRKPTHLCMRIGTADANCQTIARAAGRTSNATCSHPNTCSFLVQRPIQHPSTPGYAHVSLCLSDYAGVIFPCRENNLFIVDPDYKNDVDKESDTDSYD